MRKWKILEINCDDYKFGVCSSPNKPKDVGDMYNGEYVAIMCGDEIISDNADYYPQPITKENAKHIVKRVNQHGQLKELLEFFTEASNNHPEFDKKMDEALKLLED